MMTTGILRPTAGQFQKSNHQPSASHQIINYQLQDMFFCEVINTSTAMPPTVVITPKPFRWLAKMQLMDFFSVRSAIGEKKLPAISQSSPDMCLEAASSNGNPLRKHNAGCSKKFAEDGAARANVRPPADPYPVDDTEV